MCCARSQCRRAYTCDPTHTMHAINLTLRMQIACTCIRLACNGNAIAHIGSYTTRSLRTHLTVVQVMQRPGFREAAGGAIVSWARLFGATGLRLACALCDF